MKGIAACTCVLALFATATLAQDESESTTVTTTTSGGADLLNGLWNMDDATIQPKGSLDLRMMVGWGTGGELRDSSDDFTYNGGVLWGMTDNVEAFLYSNWVLGEGEIEGNGDITVGMTWRFREPQGNWPAMALKGSARLPSGTHSSGVDAEGRLILTNEYASGIRSHINIFGISNNGDNDLDLKDDAFDTDQVGRRNFIYGAVIGMDGPLCDDGSVRWVADYMWRNGSHYRDWNYNVIDLGWEWQMSPDRKLGMSAQISLDHSSAESDFGARITYSRALTF